MTLLLLFRYYSRVVLSKSLFKNNKFFHFELPGDEIVSERKTFIDSEHFSMATSK